ncbi:MAG TPA: HAD family hydrolase [Thermoanaerobaculia bacterium]|nr:HAD family hydrolase [Thermoanaerobaculia bacterium]
MTVQVVVFDLDGTLTATTDVDSTCYVEAFKAEFGLPLDPDWSRYRHCTDEGIAAEALQRYHDAPPSTEQLQRLKRRFVQLLATASSSPACFQAVPGALELLQLLRDAGWVVRIATGAWRASAALKIAAARLPRSIPVFACDNCPARGAILSAAIASARKEACGSLSRVVAVGDGRWDVDAAIELALPFVGVATGNRQALLREAGAKVVISDYTDPANAIAHLESAPIPSRKVVRGVG